ncbi:MAG: hypothetical protein ABIN83_05895 [Sphingomicrobium sp.]
MDARILLIAAAATGLVACETVDRPPEQRTARQQHDYDRLLAGKVPGRAESCLPLNSAKNMTVIDADTILYRDGRTTYVNSPLGGCSSLGRPGYALVTRSSISQMCRGDIATVVDTTTGMLAGSCSIGEFIPYRPAR